MQVTINENEIRIDLDLPIPREAAWILLSSPDAIGAWWGTHVVLDAREGGRFREEWSIEGRDVVTNGTVLHCEPPGLLEMTWADNRWSGQTKVRFALSEHPDGCRMTLLHGDWHHVHAQDPAELISAHAEGWQMHLGRFAALALDVTQSEK